MNWTDQELDALEREPEEWDTARAETHPPVNSPETVVAVAFDADELAEVAGAARRYGAPLSVWLRQAALWRARSGGTIGRAHV